MLSIKVKMLSQFKFRKRETLAVFCLKCVCVRERERERENLNILHGPLKEERIGAQEQSVPSIGRARAVKTMCSEHMRTHTLSLTHTYRAQVRGEIVSSHEKGT